MNVVLLGPPLNAASGWGPVGEQGAASGCEAPGRGAPDWGGWGDASDFSGKGWRGFRLEGGCGERSCAENPGFCSGGCGIGELERRGGGPRWPAEL